MKWDVFWLIWMRPLHFEEAGGFFFLSVSVGPVVPLQQLHNFEIFTFRDTK